MNPSMTTRTLSLLGTGAIALAAAVVASALHFSSAKAEVSIESGDLIRGQSYSAVYYMGADGFRYVFPNDKAYFTWYSNFDDVVFITDAQLAEIPMADNNVTYKPGVKMVKINSRPNVYVVAKGGVLHHVDSETVAANLYGSNWNTKIDDIADGFFSNYEISDESAATVGFNATTASASVDNINDDKSLLAPAEIEITANGFSPIDVEIEVGQTVRFTNTDTNRHSVTSDDLRWGSGTLETGEIFVRRYTEEGTFTFFDSYDSSNTGAVYVE